MRSIQEREADAVPQADMVRGVLLDDRYRLEDVLGQGGMATVYRAHDTVLGRDVAIKLFPPVAEHAEDVLRHQAEIRVLGQLSHPGLVTLHDAGSAHVGGPLRQTYLVMELVHGPTLADRLHEGPLSSRHAARVGRQMAEALATVHAAGVVHRDVKPANVLLVDRDGTQERASEDPALALTTGPVVKIADFGIALLADGARLTVTGTTLGTATYLSPEQAAGGVVGPATDVYALGLVLLECLTGRKAFTGTVVEVAAARLTTSPQVPTAFGAAWAEVLSAMTRRRPEERPPAAEVAAHLAAILDAPVPAGDVPTGAMATAPSPHVALDAARPLAPTGALDLTGPEPAAPPAVTTGRSGAARAGERPAVIPPRAAPTRAEGGQTGRAGSPGLPPEPTRRFAPEEVRATAERAAGEPRVRPTAAELARRDTRGRRRHRGAALAAVGVVLLGAGGLFTARVMTEEADRGTPPTYPSVDGTLGEALTDLQRSVQP
ncbi:serine/threonine-protein kinase [Actinotalea subterranea]|uniref:serine/threonine-protein kinase n=1 Tax=Actinotalea subterranea TaxID=2607497 RepID=UPI001FE39472|nr:serine/threonine-protein kinase [Actinotalea subterranea]